ncbi:hypothetical protein [Pontibacter sp. G13]|uniref:hypothetical protein n=1 Tax=Pontibacter sp. G13 TaxID=3074898 RepID=UPI00288C04B7|nr:hypothetical protein [Pontibacter sp. G13]WNJ16868.1 hypothetical protein RJD25_18545 [Pontibacter sp. G13]
MLDLFVETCLKLAETDSASLRIQYIRDGLAQISEADEPFFIALLNQWKPKKLIKKDQLIPWAAAHTQFPDWLVNRCIEESGDAGEAVGRLIPEPDTPQYPSLKEFFEEYQELDKRNPEEIEAFARKMWDRCESDTRIMINKWLTGAYRSPVRTKHVVKALAQDRNMPESELHRLLVQGFDPFEAFFLSNPNPALPSHHALAPIAFPEEVTIPGEETPELLGQSVCLSLPAGMLVQISWQGNDWEIWMPQETPCRHKLPHIEWPLEGLPDAGVLFGWLHSPAERPETLQKWLESDRKSSKSASIQLILLDIAKWDHQPLSDEWIERIKLFDSVEWPTSTEMPTKLQVPKTPTKHRPVWTLIPNQRTNTPQMIHWQPERSRLKAVLLYSRQIPKAEFPEYGFGMKQGEKYVAIGTASGHLPGASEADWKRDLNNHKTSKKGPIMQVFPQWVFELSFVEMRTAPRKASKLDLTELRMESFLPEFAANELPDLNTWLELSDITNSD